MVLVLISYLCLLSNETQQVGAASLVSVIRAH